MSSHHPPSSPDSASAEWLEQLALALPARLEQGAGLLREIKGKTKADAHVLAALEMMAGEMEGAAKVIRGLHLAAGGVPKPEVLNA